jgi:uncharacterized protein
VTLSASEIRVLGCLLEKQRTTPDAYPLSLNALRLACNQSTNRDPVVRYDDAVIRDALHRLERRGYTRLASGAGSRAPKYRHLLAEALPMTDDEQAVICVLTLRGAQTPGELKQRTERMHPFAGLDDVHATLAKLIERGLVARLGRRPGQKEERYGQLLGDADAEADRFAGPENRSAGSDHAARAEHAVGAAHSGGAEHAIGAQHSGGAQYVTGSNHAAGAANTAGGAVGSPSHTSGPAAAASVDGLEQRVARLEREVAELRAALGSRL